MQTRHHAAVAAHPARPKVRLTRRGRVVVLLFLVLLAASVVLVAANASRAAGRPGAQPVAVVGPHDTLWSVVSRHLPGREPFTAIEEVRRINALPGYTVHPGQTLRLPPPG